MYKAQYLTTHNQLSKPTFFHYRHGTGVEEEGEEGEESAKERSSSPTSAEMDLLV